MVPHGGVFVLLIPHAVEHLGLYIVAILAGTLVTAGALYLVKRPPGPGSRLRPAGRRRQALKLRLSPRGLDPVRESEPSGPRSGCPPRGRGVRDRGPRLSH